MGLFDSLKKIKDTLNSSKHVIEAQLAQAKQDISFDNFRKDMLSKSSTTPSLLHSTSASSDPEDLYHSALKNIGWKESEDGEYIRDLKVPNKKIRIDEALNFAKQLYDLGDPKAIYLLVSIYLNKSAADRKDYNQECIKLLEEGITKNDIMSLCTLGSFYAFGRLGLTQNLSKGKEYLELAAQSGAPYAYNIYAKICFMEGNSELGIGYLEEAMESGSSSAYITMGDLYCNGNGVAQDINKAIGYYSKALELGSAEACGKLGISYQLAGEKPKAIGYYKKGAILGDPLSSYMYAPYVGNETDELNLLRYAYAHGACYGTVFCENSLAPTYTYRCTLGKDTVDVQTQNPSHPGPKEVGEAYFVKYGKKLGQTQLGTAKYTRLK